MAFNYRVEVDGETVWEGEGDNYRVIPSEYLDRPADAAEGDPHPPAHFLYETVEGGGEQLFGVQISLIEELTDTLGALRAQLSGQLTDAELGRLRSEIAVIELQLDRRRAAQRTEGS